MIEIQRADPEYRRRVGVMVAAGALAGAALIFLFERHRPEVLAWVTDDPSQVARRFGMILVLTAALSTLSLLGLAVYLWRLGSRILRTRQFPPPGARVVRDTPVVRASAALRRGYLARVFAGLLVSAAVALLYLLRRVWDVTPP